MNKVKYLSLIMIMVLLLTGCGNNSNGGYYKGQKNSAGNTSGNLAQGGLVVENKDYVYHALYKDNGIYKLKKKDSSIFKSEVFIANVDAYDLNIVGDYLYYAVKTKNSSEEEIRKTKLDGSTTQTIAKVTIESSPIHLNVTKDSIYYNDYDEAIYKISINGGESQKLAEVDASMGMYVNDGWIYYAGRDGLGRIKTNGSENTELYGGTVNDHSMILDNGYVYFFPYYYDDSYSKFYKIKEDGSGTMMVLPSNPEGTPIRPNNIYNDWMYIRQEMWGALYKAKVDGSNYTDLTEKIDRDTNTGGNYTFVVEDWVYGLIPTDTWAVYEVHQDGSNYQLKNCNDIGNAKCDVGY